jgi:hypothetical protein
MRWVIATAVVVAAIGWEVTRSAEEPFPFAERDIAAGSTINDEDIDWRSLPAGVAVVPSLTDAVALTDIRSGDPLTASVAGTMRAIPPDWWSVPIALPVGVPRGAHVRLSLADGRSTEGVVDIPGSEDSFGVMRRGAVAVPEQWADAIARAEADGGLVVMLPPMGQSRTNEIAPNATQ